MCSYRYICFVITLILVGFTNSERRIKNGIALKDRQGKRYMVYLLRALASPQEYDAWLCGGAIVTTKSIITSAACVEDVKYMYVVSGYNRYRKIEENGEKEDDCLKYSKRKVVTTCVPKRYNFAYDRIEKWAFIDIAVAKVDREFDFQNTAASCSYPAGYIRVNFEAKYQKPGIDAFVLGWGHSSQWRDVNDKADYNKDILHYASTTLQDKDICKKEYEKTPAFLSVIDRYMICAYGAGNIDLDGEQIITPNRNSEGCIRRRGRIRNIRGKRKLVKPYYSDPMCVEELFARRNELNKTDEEPEMSSETESNNDTDNTTDIDYIMANETNVKLVHDMFKSRRNGICQNDHGGPLVTWVGSREYLIGVASVFRVENNTCTGPYLYTSTECNSAFLDCVLREDSDWDSNRGNPNNMTDNNKPPELVPTVPSRITPPLDQTVLCLNYRFLRNKIQRKAFCDLPPSKKGFDMVRRHISWVNHPDGPAEGELDLVRLEIRPQVPIGSFG